MEHKDEVTTTNERHWQRMVQERCGYTIPWLDLDANLLRRYARGEVHALPGSIRCVGPRSVLADVDNKDLLCLAAGGGQQSAVFALLGARVTVVDLAQGQLEGDRRAAAHYGYEITTIQGDMRDLSCLNAASFDIVYGTATCYVPDVRQVYAEVARVLRPGGLYRTDTEQPAVHFIEWDGAGYRISKPYFEYVDRRDNGAVEFRHYMDDIFNGLRDVGLSILQIEDPARFEMPDPGTQPGSWTHESAYVGGGFVIVARRADSYPPRTDDAVKPHG